MSNPRVEFRIVQGDEDWGAFVVELDPKRAPETVANFIQYINDNFFDGTVFHRVIPTFMIQGGGYLPSGEPKREGLRSPIRNEAETGLKNQTGCIAMARTSDPHSATCQFFINTADNTMLDYPGHDGWGYCAFGRVVSGQDVVDRIRDVETQYNPAMGENSQPVDPPIIRSARMLNGD